MPKPSSKFKNVDEVGFPFTKAQISPLTKSIKASVVKTTLMLLSAVTGTKPQSETSITPLLYCALAEKPVQTSSIKSIFFIV